MPTTPGGATDLSRCDMHFALPPRKTSRPPPYATSRSLRIPALRSVRLRSLSWIIGAVVALTTLILGIRYLVGFERTPAGTPSVVIVTTLDPAFGESYEKMIVANRREYAAKHGMGVQTRVGRVSLIQESHIGYATFFPSINDYNLAPANPLLKSWSRLPAMRHAMALYPYSKWYWFLDQRAMIMNPGLDVDAHITTKRRLESMMMTDVSIVPPDGIIKTFRSHRAENVDLIISQDKDGVTTQSFLLRRGDWARYFLDAWFDPLYRSYNFQQGERDALEHLLQWHGSILTRLALVPQKTLNAYLMGGTEQYAEGDFVANLHDCDKHETRSCEREALPLFERFRALIGA